MRLHLILVAACLLRSPLSAATVEAEAAPAPAPAPVHSFRLVPAPLWAGSAALSSDGRDLVVVDAIRSVVYRYDLGPVLQGDPEARLTGRLSARDTDLGPAFRPTRIERSGDRYLLQVEDALYPLVEREGRFLALRRSDRSEPALAAHAADAGAGPGWEMGGLFRWAALEGGGVFAYADLKRGVDDWTSGFVCMPEGHPSEPEVVHEVALDSTARQFHLHLEPLIAAIGDDALFLVYEKVPTIYRYRRSAEHAEKLGPVPEPYRHLPTLPRSVGPDGSPARHRIIEGTTMPAGLLAQDDALFLLTREPAGPSGATRWKLHRLDEAGRVAEVLELPTKAPHVTVVPGRPHWVLIERGSVDEGLRQDNSNALLIPARWISADVAH